MKKTIMKWLTPIVALGMIIPLIALAREGGDSNPVQYGSWVKAIDLHGDHNAIGKFNSNNGNHRLAHVEGVVTVASPTSISVKQTKNGVDTTYAFTVDSNTTIIRKFKGTAAIGEVGVSDKVKVYATALTSGTAKLIWDKSIWWVALKGTISALDTTAKTFTLNVTRKEPETGLPMTLAVPITTSSMTTFWQGVTAKAFTDLANGQTVNLRGTFNFVGKFVLASRISIQ